MVDFLLIGRPLAGVEWEEGVVEEAFLPVAGCLWSDRWAPGWVLGFVLLRVFDLRRRSVFSGIFLVRLAGLSGFGPALERIGFC